MKLKKALLIAMARWQVTGYRLSQVSSVDKSLLAKLLRGDSQTASWEKVDKLVYGFGKIEPAAKETFSGVLHLPDSAYPNLSDNTVDLPWVRELPENIAAVMAVLDEYKLLDRENIKKLQAKLAEKNREQQILIGNTLEDFIGNRMSQIRRKQDGSTQDA